MHEVAKGSGFFQSIHLHHGSGISYHLIPTESWDLKEPLSDPAPGGCRGWKERPAMPEKYCWASAAI